MNRRSDGWSLALAGFWNRAIFLPDWALPRLFPLHLIAEYRVDIEVALLSALPLIYRDPEVAMEISHGYLNFRPQVLNDACLNRCERMARDMLVTLPDTPVHAIDINFGFREAHAPANVVAMFSEADSVQLSERGWATSERRAMRKMTQGGDTLLLTVTLTGEMVDFDFNFHTDTSGNNAMAQQSMAEGRILRLRDIAMGLLRETYNLVIEDENVADGE